MPIRGSLLRTRNFFALPAARSARLSDGGSRCFLVQPKGDTFWRYRFAGVAVGASWSFFGAQERDVFQAACGSVLAAKIKLKSAAPVIRATIAQASFMALM